MILPRHSLPWVLLAALLPVLGACGREQPASEGDTSSVVAGAAGVGVHSDGDSLDDAAEAELGTSPFSEDTDGDGFEDDDEILEYGFDGNSNPTRFNPRVADVPRIRVDVVSAPVIYLTHTVSATESRSFDNTLSATSSTSVSTNVTYGSSVRTEVSNTIGGEVSNTWGVMPGTTVSVSGSRTWSTARETSFNWSATQSRENSRTLSESQGYSRTHDVSRSGGRVEVAVDIVNTGHVACTLHTIALGLRKLDPGTGKMREIGQLEPATDRTFQDVTSLAPEEPVRGMVFAADLPLDKAELLLAPGPMAVRTLMYELWDENGRSFDHRFTKIDGKTATITVDAGVRQEPRTWRVATWTQDGEGLPLSVALRDVLRIPFETGTTLWRYRDGVRPTKAAFTSLAGVAADSASGGYWTVEIETDDGRGGTTRSVHPLRDELDLDAIRLTPTETVRLVYVVDRDRDGVGERTEALLGLDPERYDTDGDGVGDGDELLAGTNPLHGRARADVMTVEGSGRTLRLHLHAAASEGGHLAGIQVDWGDGTEAEDVAADDQGRASVEHEYPEVGEYVVEVRPVEETQGDVRGGRVRVRLESPFLEAWAVEATPHRVTDLACGPAGAYLRTAEDAPGRNERYGIVRIGPDGSARWSHALGSQRREEMPWWKGGYVRLAVDGSGNAYVTDHHSLLSFAPDGKERWAVALPVLTVAAGDDDTAFVTLWRQRSPQYTLARIDAGQITWRRTMIYDPQSYMPVKLTPGGGGDILLSEMSVSDFALAQRIDRVRRMDGDGKGDAVFEVSSDASSLQAPAPEGGIVLAGRNGGWYGKGPERAGIWLYDAGGTLLWSDVAPPSGWRNQVSALATAPDGRVFAIVSAWTGDRPDTGGEWRAELVAYDTEGRVTSRTQLDEAEPDRAVGFGLAADADGVYVVSSPGEGAATLRRLLVNPAATCIVGEE